MNAISLEHADRAIWIAIAAVACAVSASSAFGPFHIEWLAFWKASAVIGLLLSVSWFYATIRKDTLLAEALMGAAQIIAFATLAAPLSYIAASADFPLWDAELTIWDRRLGLDWMAWLAALNATPVLHTILSAAYASFAIQTTAIVVALAATGHALRLRVFILGFIVLTLVTIAVSTVMPAQGVWGYWHLSAADSPAIVPITRDTPLQVFFGLRDGSFRNLVAEGAEGVISFPSLHAALGMLFILAMWPVKYLGRVSLVLNILMILATPVEGSHYFCDVFAGLTLAVLSWLAVSRTLSGAPYAPFFRMNFRTALAKPSS